MRLKKEKKTKQNKKHLACCHLSKTQELRHSYHNGRVLKKKKKKVYLTPSLTCTLVLLMAIKINATYLNLCSFSVPVNTD